MGSLRHPTVILALALTAATACLEPNPNAPVDTGEANTNADTNTGTNTNADTSMDTGDTTTGVVQDCVDYEVQDDCEADEACQAVVGTLLKENGANAPCLEAVEFLGCIDMGDCDAAETWFCTSGGNPKTYLIPNSCGPEGMTECDPGVDTPPTCN